MHVRVWLCVSMASSVDSRPYHQDHTSRIMRGKSNHKGENLEMYGNYHNLFVVDAIHKYLWWDLCLFPFKCWPCRKKWSSEQNLSFINRKIALTKNGWDMNSPVQMLMPNELHMALSKVVHQLWHAQEGYRNALLIREGDGNWLVHICEDNARNKKFSQNCRHGTKLANLTDSLRKSTMFYK